MTSKKRCAWPGEDPLYVAYHDEEWGVPEYDDRALYEKLVLDGFQAGRDNFRRAFDRFEPRKIARYNEAKIAKLLEDEGIIRHRGKIEGAIKSARAWLDIMEKEPGGFSAYIWSFVGGKPVVNHYTSIKQVPAETPMSQALSKDLKKRGFTFCGPTIVYAFAQAVGIVNDHVVGCFRHKQVQKAPQR
jgi:DNA-3-methyladenine glycosylase I